MAQLCPKDAGDACKRLLAWGLGWLCCKLGTCDVNRSNSTHQAVMESRQAVQGAVTAGVTFAQGVYAQHNFYSWVLLDQADDALTCLQAAWEIIPARQSDPGLHSDHTSAL